jgi:hypothetical protein
VVIFDEASQVTPADAVPAILRGRQLVVAGDSRQLPPTAFFATDTVADQADLDVEPAVDDDGVPVLDLGLSSGYESVLDVVQALLRPGHLTWHYRSRDERLIAFSNQQIYDGMLTTFPGIAASPAIGLEVVDPADPGEEGVAAEVRRVVALVLEHARHRPDESLGVITMGIRHATRVEEAGAAPSPPPRRNRVLPGGHARALLREEPRVGAGRRATRHPVDRLQQPRRPPALPLRSPAAEGGERRLNVAITGPVA